MWPARGAVDRDFLVGVHLEELADALLLALGGVDHLGAGVDVTGVHADEGQLAEERVRSNLEGESRERLVCVGLRVSVLLFVAGDRDRSSAATSSGFGR